MSKSIRGGREGTEHHTTITLYILILHNATITYAHLAFVNSGDSQMDLSTSLSPWPSSAVLSQSLCLLGLPLQSSLNLFVSSAFLCSPLSTSLSPWPSSAVLSQPLCLLGLPLQSSLNLFVSLAFLCSPLSTSLSPRPFFIVGL